MLDNVPCIFVTPSKYKNDQTCCKKNVDYYMIGKKETLVNNSSKESYVLFIDYLIHRAISK